MAEQNNQAERAAPGMEMYQCPFCDRRAALPAVVDAEGLPPPLKYGTGLLADYVSGYNQALMDVAADHRKQAALTQMIELGQEIEASGELQSIGDDPEFRRLLANVQHEPNCRMDGEDKALIAYIDGRTAGAAPEPIAEAMYWKTAGASGWSFKWLGETPKDFAEFELYAAPSHQSPGQEGTNG